jgi:hypothetical protein
MLPSIQVQNFRHNHKKQQMLFPFSPQMIISYYLYMLLLALYILLLQAFLEALIVLIEQIYFLGSMHAYLKPLKV